MDSLFGSSTSGQMSVRARKALFENGAADEQKTQTSRNPLGFLSPNNFKKRSSNKQSSQEQTDKEDIVEQLKHQVNSIQRRINGLDQKANLPDLKDIVFNQAQSKQQHEQLQELTRKLIHIQTGLREIEGERCALVTKSKQLEHEKRHLSSQLRVREQEIEALQKRCLVESEKAKEIGTLRTINSDLNLKMRQLEKSMETQVDHDEEKRDLLNQLSASQKSINNIEQRLESIQKDYDTVCNNLAKGLQDVEQLTIEKQSWEEEKRRLQQRTDLKFDQLRLAHMNCTIELKEELSAYESKSKEQDRLLVEQNMTVQHLRNQVQKLESNQSNAVETISNDYERKLEALRKSYETNLSLLQEQHYSEIKDLNDKLASRNVEVASLREDMASQMQDLMLATSHLQKLQAESKTLEEVLEDVEVLESDRLALQDELHEKNTEIAELSAEILKLEIEKELASSTVSKCLQERNELVDAASSEKDITIRSLESKVSQLTKQLETSKSQSSWTFGLVEREHHLQVQQLKEQLTQVQSDYRSAQAKISEQSYQLEQATQHLNHSPEIAGLNSTIYHLQLEIEKSQADRESRDNEMASLEAALQDHVKRLAEVINENAELQNKVCRAGADYGNMEEKSSHLQVRLLDREDEISRLQQQWKQKEDDYLDKINEETLRREVCENDLFVLRNKLDRTSATNRDLAELEKENQSLKDKVRRQESYLRRKLDQQKAIRGRSVGLLSVPPSHNSKFWARKHVPSQETATTADDSLEWESLDDLLIE